MANFKIFSGTANPELSSKIAKELGVELGKVEIIRFADTESRVWVEEKVKDQTVFLIQPFSPRVDENLVEFLLLADALRRGKPEKMIAVVPYYGYARQDKIFRDGEALSAQVIANLIEGACFKELITIHLHSLNILDFFKIPIKHLSTVSVFAKAFASLKEEKGQWVAVGPDEVALTQVKNLAKDLGLTTACLEKRRNYAEKDRPMTTGLEGDVSGKNVIMFDDLSSTGGTIINGAKFLKERGAQKIMAALTHLVVPEVIEKITGQDFIDKLFITDTIPQKKADKLEIVSVAPLIAEAIMGSV
ncbi:ribose-phosphate pyrophosphokinase [Candidatus Microgenomates bacterium]|nr:ribose-phosphate pyrophosphokinase [Candidatus Microgenomates bacterium]